ncbi:hypothetical protein V5799_030943 [Amblyomma americanum]|uniref:Uncharacterized protein n=1 Tax=Amblyomma americanum TaxID=6943 RepID=A0AAQ4ELU5_AMBAM
MGQVLSRKVPRWRWIFFPQLPPPLSGRVGFEVGADCLQAASPAVRFHGGGGFFLCNSLHSGWGGFKVAAGRLSVRSRMNAP